MCGITIILSVVVRFCHMADKLSESSVATSVAPFDGPRPPPASRHGGGWWCMVTADDVTNDKQSSGEKMASLRICIVLQQLFQWFVATCPYSSLSI
jgi:hypothetical protein